MNAGIVAGVLLVALQGPVVAAQGGPPQTPAGKPLFRFHNGLRVNLHHFLYVLGRARNGEPDSQRRAVVNAPRDLDGFDRLDARERQSWEDAIAFYRSGPSKSDVLFDAELVRVTRALAAADDAAPLEAIDIPKPFREALEGAEPAYRKVWWARHARANQARIAGLEDLLARYGRAISGRLTRAYQREWTDTGFVVEIAAYSNWAGAYSASGGPIVMSSTDEGSAGSLGLEIIFHEAMHQWDDAMIPLLQKAARQAGARIPRALSHSLIFYTAGYVAAQVAPGHRPYAEAMWARGSLAGRAELDAHWLPWLRGEGSFDAAIASLVTAFR